MMPPSLSQKITASTPTTKAIWDCYAAKCAPAAPSESEWEGQIPHPSGTINADFWLMPEVGTVEHFGGTERVKAQLRRWRRAPVFGLMENKLLAHSLLEALHIRQPEVIYGAFATKALGKWPAYARKDLMEAMHGKRRFVLKSATNGGNVDVLVMDPARWESEDWTASRLADYVERFVKPNHPQAKWWSEWGQVYEHRAVIVQESFVPRIGGGFGCIEGELHLEAKVHAPLGRLASARLQALPFDGAKYLDVQFVANGITCLGGRNLANTTAHCARAVRLLTHHRPALERAAATTSHALGADWMRLDVFLTEGGVLSVNELSYPSHIGSFTGGGDEISISPLREAYAHGRLARAPAALFLAPLLRACDVDPYAFLLAADFRMMRHASEATYDGQLWQWDPKADDERAARRGDHLRTSAACVAIVAFGLLLLGVVSALLPRESTTEGQSVGERSATLDNAKFICSSLIIYGHFLYYNLDHSTHLQLIDYQSWLSGADSLVLFLLQVTNWRINLACFISGHLMARPVSSPRFESFCKNLVLPTLLWVLLAKPVVLKLLGDGDFSRAALANALSTLLTGRAFHHEWYLEALILWRLLSFAIWPMRGRYVVALTLCASSFGGYWSIGEGGFFSWDHAFGFLPYFIAGWACPLDRLATAVPQTPRTISLGLALMVGLPMLMTRLDPLPDNHGTYGWFWASSEFEATRQLMSEGEPLAFRLYWARRAAKNVLEIVQALVVLLTLVPRSTRWFTHLGRHTLYAFLLHELALGWRNRLIALLPLPVVTSTPLHVVVLASQYAFCVALCAGLCSRPTRRVFGVFLEPGWLSRILCVPSSAATCSSDERQMRPPCEHRPLLPDTTARGRCLEEGLVEGKPLPTPLAALGLQAELPRLGPNPSAVPPANGADAQRQQMRGEASAEERACVGGWLKWASSTAYSKGRRTLPWQQSGNRYMRYLILLPLLQLACMAFSAFVVLPHVQRAYVESGLLASCFDALLSTPALLVPVVLAYVADIVYQIGADVVTFAHLFKGLERPTLPADRARLTHAIIVCAYKEPYDVLALTIKSLRSQHLVRNTIVILATESCDESADSTFERLRHDFGSKFKCFMQTKHVLAAGEVAGKSSNERHACIELYEYVSRHGIDPYSVMVTTADADSQFDRCFLDHLEAEFCCQPDGRHTLYDSPINTSRNVAACNPIVGVFEIERTQYCTFSALQFQPCQSNYSLTLGFAHLIDYWHPDNTSEDLHTTLKALAFTDGAANVVVPVWSLILNDSVTGWSDRWVQAKRHMWGIEEVAWVLSLFPLLRLKVWMRMLSLTAAKMLTVTVVPPWLLIVSPQFWSLAMALPTNVLHAVVAATIFRAVVGWVQVFAREYVMHTFILKHRKKTMLPIPLTRWLHWAIAYPLYSILASLVFNTAATWAMLIHAVTNVTYGYVCAPKELGISIGAVCNDDEDEEEGALAVGLSSIPDEELEQPILLTSSTSSSETSDSDHTS